MASSTGGKVGNMRALFEAKQETSSSPPSRGRSPAGSDIHSIRSLSSRPVSKIRTSFVAVEKSGNMGPILGLRRVSDVQDKPELDIESRRSVTRSTSNAGRDSIAEEKELESNVVADKQDEDIKVEQEAEGKIIPNGDIKIEDASEIDSSVPERKKKATHTPGPIKTAISSRGSTVSTKRQSSTPKGTPVRTRAEPLKTATTTLRTRPSPNSPQTASTKVKSAAINSEGSTSASKPRARHDPVSKPESRVSTPRTSLASVGPRETRPTKSRVKSPTRPVRLPAAAMASTASSAAKTTAAEKASSQSSSKSRVSSDNDFLARMMKPTAASASKVHEKSTSSSGFHKTNAPKPRRSSPVSKKRVSEGSAKLSAATSRKTVPAVSTPPKDDSALGSEEVETGIEDKAAINGVTGITPNQSDGIKEESDFDTVATSDASAGTEKSERQAQKMISTNSDSEKNAIPIETSTGTEDATQSTLQDDVLKTSQSIPSTKDNAEQPISHDIEVTEDSTEADHDDSKTHKDHDMLESMEASNESKIQPQSASRTQEQHATSTPTENVSLANPIDELADTVSKEPISDIIGSSSSQTEPSDATPKGEIHISPTEEPEAVPPTNESHSATAEDPADS